jgi:hypothetical protein
MVYRLSVVIHIIILMIIILMNLNLYSTLTSSFLTK